MSNPAAAYPVWRTPLILAGLIISGLLDSLLIDSTVARALAWGALAIPIFVGIRCMIPLREN